MIDEVRIRTSGGRYLIPIGADYIRSLGLANPGDSDLVSLFISSWLALLADSPLKPQQKPISTFRAFLRRIAQDGLKATVLRFSDLAHKLVSQINLMGTTTSIGDWIDEFKDTPVFFEYNRYFRTGDPSLLRFLYTFLNFGKKLEIRDETFEEVAFRDWLGIEKRLHDQCAGVGFIPLLREILRQVLPRFTWDGVWPKFGPGSVQERGVRGRLDKIDTLSFDGLIDRFLLNGHLGNYGIRGAGTPNPLWIIPKGVWDPRRGQSSRTARLRFVPKNLKVARSICMEPNTLMYFQQAVATRIWGLLRESLFVNFIDVHDQTRNQVLAQYGSYTGEIDTLDLSAASDSVRLSLVKGIFPPSWLIPMLSTRSSSAYTPSGDTVSLEKFAPMGSALCFPTQSIIFTSVVVLAAILRAYERCPYTESIEEFVRTNVANVVKTFANRPVPYGSDLLQPLSVYGDDICVDGKLTQKVVHILTSLGFVVNQTKSFVGSQSFRESCGGFYLEGHDITPLYFRVKTVRTQVTPEHLSSHVHLCNAARAYGYKNLYSFLRNAIMEWGGHGANPIPYVSDTDQFGIIANAPQNNHLKVRENDDYQRTEYHCWTISYDHVDHPDSLEPVDTYEYMRWCACRRAGVVEDFPQSISRADKGGARLKWKWIPLQ